MSFLRWTQTETILFLRKNTMTLKGLSVELLKNQDQQEDSKLKMVWYSLFSLMVFPLLLMISSVFGLEDAGKNLSEMSSIFFLTIGGIVSVYFGANSYQKKNGK